MTISGTTLTAGTSWIGSPRAAWEKFDDQVRGQFFSGLERLRRVRHDRVAAVLLSVWVFGIAADGLTTVFMLRAGGGQVVEGNPAALALMGLVGVEGWGVVASLLCLPLVVLSLGTVRGMYARTAWGASLLVGAGKVWFGVTNYLLWLQVSG